MPTVAELQIVLEAQDRASAQLRRLGGEVTRLERQVESAGRRGGSGGLLGSLLQGGGIGAGLAAVQGAFRGLQGVFDLVGDSVFTLNSNLEQSTATFRAFTGSAAAAQAIVEDLRREADVTPFDTDEIIRAGSALISSARGGNQELMELLRTAEQLAAFRPLQGLEGATFALREAIQGDFTSIIDRFDLGRASLQRFRDQGMSNLEAVRAEMQRVGATAELVERLGQTFEGRRSTIVSFFDELRRRLGEGLFVRISDAFGRMVELIAQYGERLRAMADTIGAFIGGILERAIGALEPLVRRLFDAFAPGLWDDIVAGWQRMAPAVQETGRAMQQTAPAAESVTRSLARIGVEAAELQLEAGRVRRAYADQLEPLERQLRVLQQSADLQRVQNALATNRATVEGIRLEREVAALQRAARGQEDPNAPGLSLRQRMIALALQERRLRQEELGIEEQRRPLIQSLEQQVAAITEQQRAALAPLERQLELRREEADRLNILRQREQERVEAMREAAEQAKATWRMAADPEALATAKKRGEELADEWLKGWTEWIERNGGNILTALWRSFRKWYDGGGKEQFQQLGTDIGTAMGEAAAAAAGSAIGQRLRQEVESRVAGSSAAQIADEVARGLFTGPAGAGASGGGGSAFGGEGMNVNVNVNGADPGVAQRFRDQLRAQIDEFIRGFFAAEAATDPGASPALQGAGRAP